MKTCCRCKETKVLSEFYKQGRAAYCKYCEKQYMAEWLLNNAQRNSATKARWRKENKEVNTTIKKAWAAANRDRCRKAGAKWQKINPEKMNARAAKHRAQKLRATPVWANEFFIEEAYHLAQLRTKMLGFEWQVDHIVPLRSKLVCGFHCEANLQVIPAKENVNKSNKYWPDMPGEI